MEGRRLHYNKKKGLWLRGIGLVFTALALMLFIRPENSWAATKTKLTQKSQTLYVGGAKGTNQKGVKSDISDKKNIKNLVTVNGKKFNDKTMTLEIVPDQEGIVAVEGTYIRALAPGRVGLTITVRSATSGKKLGKSVELTADIRKNADSAVLRGLKEGQTLIVDNPVTVNCLAEGSPADTDLRRLVVKRVDGKEAKYLAVAGKAEGEYQLTFLETGEYTVASEAYQNKKYSVATARAEVKVTVQTYAESIGFVGISQTGLDTFTLDFNRSPYSLNVGAEDLYVYTLWGDTHKIPEQVPLKYAPYVSGNKIVVTANGKLVRNTEYFCEYAGAVYSFKAVGDTAEDITRVVLSAPILIARNSINKYTPSSVKTSGTVGYTFYNSIGMKINQMPNSGLSWEVVEESRVKEGLPAIVSGNTVSVYEVGDRVVLNAYFYKTDENGKTIKVNADQPAVMTGVAYETPTGRGYTEISYANKFNNLGYLCPEAIATVDYKIEYQYAAGNKQYVSGASRGYTFEIDTSSRDIAFMKGTNQVYGIRRGDVVVAVKNTEGQVVDTIPVHVDYPPASFTATISANSMNVYPTANDEVYIDISVFDSKGDPYTCTPVGFSIKSTGIQGGSNGYVISSGTVYTSKETGKLRYKLTGRNLVTQNAEVRIDIITKCESYPLNGSGSFVLKVYNKEVG